MTNLIEAARLKNKDFICLSSGLADHWVCVHCEAWSPGEWGETPKAIKHKPHCQFTKVEGDRNV